jgi:hypothetical protein
MGFSNETEMWPEVGAGKTFEQGEGSNPIAFD